MRLGIKGKQVVGVTSIVVTVVVVLSVLHLARLARVSLDESSARAELLANAIYHRAQQVVVGGADPLAALRADPGLRSILESSLYSKNVMYAALVYAAIVVIRSVGTAESIARITLRTVGTAIIGSPATRTWSATPVLALKNCRSGTKKYGCADSDNSWYLESATTPTMVTASPQPVNCRPSTLAAPK